MKTEYTCLSDFTTPQIIKEPELTASHDEQLLYFKLRNTGHELVSDISVEIQFDSSAIDCKQNNAEIAVIGSGMTKEISFPIIVHSPVSKNIMGTLCFSDRAGSNKTLPFSFPVSALKRRIGFFADSGVSGHAGR